MRKTLAAGAAFVAVLAFVLFPRVDRGLVYTVPSGTCPKVVAHRTAMLLAPENTVAGIRAVPATGAAGVELDVQWSSSGFPVLMHDTTVDRTTNSTGAPSTMGLGQLLALTAVDDPKTTWKADPRYTGVDALHAVPHVPYGWDFMNAVAAGGLDVQVDVHAAPTQVGMDKLVHYLDLFGWSDRAILMGPPDWVTAMHGWEPQLHYAVIEYNAATTIRRGESIVATGAEAYVVPARDVTPAAVTYWHSYGLRVMSWSSDSAAIDSPATWLRLSDAGVDEITTNQPAAALAALRPVCTPTTEPPSPSPSS